MRPIVFLTLACSGLFMGCAASIPPTELVNARQAYQHAKAGQAAQLVPAELQKAKAALALAELSFLDDPQSFRTRDLAYVADRKAKLADALAGTASKNATTARANSDYRATQAEMALKEHEDLATSERKAAVERDTSGLVITLPDSMLFELNSSVLMTRAHDPLDQVMTALVASKEPKLTIEGHTDTKGSSHIQKKLTQNRADAVRMYFISRGYSSSLIQSKGVGSERPIADNATAGGRAKNRRIEIIIDHVVIP